MTEEGTPRERFTDAMRDLWQEANCPSTHALAVSAGVAKATAHSTLSGRTLPNWDLASKLITALGGDPDAYNHLWTEARAQSVKASYAPQERAHTQTSAQLVANVIREGLADIAAAIRDLNKEA